MFARIATILKRYGNAGMKKTSKGLDITLLNIKLNYDHQDEGQWRSYELDSRGTTKEELIVNGWVWEIDQDGGNLKDYPLGDADTGVYKAAISAISELAPSE